MASQDQQDQQDQHDQSPPELHGTHDPRFDTVAQLLRADLQAGRELGLCLAIDIDGETVLDLWGGYQDSDRTRPWQRDTIINVWSCSKLITNLAALRLHSAGELDLDAPVAAYWPQFAQNGKSRVLVRHVLGHTSGLAGWDEPIELADVYDSGDSVARLAGQRPWWEPGTAHGYHILTQGHLIGELVRRITGIPLKQFVADEIAGPQRADFQLGVAPHDVDAGRVADVISPPYEMNFAHRPPTDIRRRAFTGPAIDGNLANSPQWRSATLGAANGHANARALVQILRNVTLDSGFLADATRERIFEQQSSGRDLVLVAPFSFGLGFAMPNAVSVPFLPEGRIAFWGGWGGSLGICDLDRRVTIAYAMNKIGDGMIGSTTSAAYCREIYRCLGVDLISGLAGPDIS